MSHPSVSYTHLFPCFDVVADGKPYAHVALHVPGKHNISNALAAAACSPRCGPDGRDSSRRCVSGPRGWFSRSRDRH